MAWSRYSLLILVHILLLVAQCPVNADDTVNLLVGNQRPEPWVAAQGVSKQKIAEAKAATESEEAHMNDAEEKAKKAESADATKVKDAEKKAAQAESAAVEAHATEQAVEQKARSKVAQEESTEQTAESQAMQAESAKKAADIQATQQIRSAESQAAQAHSAQQAAQVKARQEVHAAESEAAKANSARRNENAKAQQQIREAQTKAQAAQSAEAMEEAKATQQIHLLKVSLEQQVHKAQSMAAQAKFAQEFLQESPSFIFLTFGVLISIILLLLQKTRKGRSLKDRMSGKFYGVFVRKDAKRQWLLGDKKAMGA